MFDMRIKTVYFCLYPDIEEEQSDKQFDKISPPHTLHASFICLFILFAFPTAHAYWSKVVETNEAKNIPFWNCKKAHASAIEATAYALLVFLRQGGTNTDAIADWLVGQRNYNGAFIRAMVSVIFVETLSASWWSFEPLFSGCLNRSVVVT